MIELVRECVYGSACMRRVCVGCAVGGQVLLLAWTVDVHVTGSMVGLAVFFNKGVCSPHNC